MLNSSSLPRRGKQAAHLQKASGFLKNYGKKNPTKAAQPLPPRKCKNLGDTVWQQGGGKAARAQLPSLGHATAMAGAREVWLGLQVLPGEDLGLGCSLERIQELRSSLPCSGGSLGSEWLVWCPLCPGSCWWGGKSCPDRPRGCSVTAGALGAQSQLRLPLLRGGCSDSAAAQLLSTSLASPCLSSLSSKIFTSMISATLVTSLCIFSLSARVSARVCSAR